MKNFHTLLYSILILSFTLGIQHGKLALWEDGHREPIAVFPLRAAHLPEADRQLLHLRVKQKWLFTIHFTIMCTKVILQTYIQ